MPPRTSREVAAALKRGEFEPVYYFHGTEEVLKEDMIRYMLDRALDPSVRDFNFDQRSAGQLDPEAVEALCNTLPMMAERRVVLIREIDQWKRKTKARTAFLSYLERPAPETVVILVQSATEKDADKDLVKRAASIEFPPQTAAEARKWMERRAAAKGVVFAPGAAEHLLKCTGTDLGAIRLELDKLGALPPGTEVTIEQVGDLVGVRHGETQFDWRDAVLDGDAARGVKLIERVLEQSGMSGVKLVTLLGTTLVGLGVTRAAYDRNVRGSQLERTAFDALRAARPFGLGSWKEETAHWARWAPHWPAARLRAALDATLSTDRALKSTTLSDERGLLADLVMRLTMEQKVEA